MNLKEKLTKIQTEMKVPKNLFNKFGNYNYRNVETIYETFKPLGEKYKANLIMKDEIILIGERFYVKAIAELIDNESEDQIVTYAFARESLEKKGMDDAQVTGSTSSYARKYALNALFLLDDNKDIDSEEYKGAAKKAEPSPKVAKIKDLLKKTKVSPRSMLNSYGASSVESLTEEQMDDAIEKLGKRLEPAAPKVKMEGELPFK